MNAQKQINLLYKKLENLQKSQAKFNDEIIRLRFQIDKLQQKIAPQQTQTQEAALRPIVTTEKPAVLSVSQDKKPTPQAIVKPKKVAKIPKQKSLLKSDLERFIGENIINKIGILILLIGVVIGVKYAINNNIITPTARIVLGYLVGFVLLGTAFKLKEKYHAFSAVLLSGAMASLYFITYAAFSFYQIIPQTVAFALMVLFTVFTVISALSYKEQVIAIIGLVGAYAVPFLLSTGSGNVVVLLSYTALVNIGILYVAFKQDWKIAYYFAYAFSWLIIVSWFMDRYDDKKHFGIILGFSFLFYLIFYTMFLAYKLIKKENYDSKTIVLLLSNSFVFYGLGFAVLSHSHSAYLGIFTVLNALINFGVAQYIYTKKLGDKKLFYLVIVLTLVFVTAAVPVQLQGNWITLVWLVEAALLFWLGASKRIQVFIKLAYIMIVLAFFSLAMDWNNVPHYYNYEGIKDNSHSKIPLFFHINFIVSLLAAVAFSWISYLRFTTKETLVFDKTKWYHRVFTFAIPIVTLIVLYQTFALEITRYWSQKITETTLYKPEYHTDGSLYSFKQIWLSNYTLFFSSILALLVNKFIKNKTIKLVAFVFVLLTVFMFLTGNLLAFGVLRENYIKQTDVTYYYRGAYHIYIRYISYLFLIFAVFSIKPSFKTFIKPKLAEGFELFIHLLLLWILSSELIQIMALQGFTGVYKFSLSILWGVYALVLISLGIGQHKKAFRIAGIALFALTLVKLFFYDITHLNTIAKTIIFMVLGALLLLISFLYNKYNAKIFDNDTEQK